MSKEQKSQVRTSRVILILLGIGMIISLYLIVTATNSYFQGEDTWQTPLLVGLAILGGITAFNFLIRQREPEVEWYTVSQIKCEQEGCEYSEIRDFKEGDYVYKKLGNCPSCGGQSTLYIDLVYAYNPLEVKPERIESPRIPQSPQSP